MKNSIYMDLNLKKYKFFLILSAAFLLIFIAIFLILKDPNFLPFKIPFLRSDHIDYEKIQREVSFAILIPKDIPSGYEVVDVSRIFSYREELGELEGAMIRLDKTGSDFMDGGVVISEYIVSKKDYCKIKFSDPGFKGDLVQIQLSSVTGNEAILYKDQLGKANRRILCFDVPQSIVITIVTLDPPNELPDEGFLGVANSLMRIDSR